MTAPPICQHSHMSNRPRPTATSMARLRTALFRQPDPCHRSATSEQDASSHPQAWEWRRVTHPALPNPKQILQGSSSPRDLAKVGRLASVWDQGTKRRHQCLEGVHSEGQQPFHDAPATHRSWNPDPGYGMEAAEVSPPSGTPHSRFCKPSQAGRMRR